MDDFGQACRRHRSLAVGSERCSGSSRARNAAKSLRRTATKRPGQRALAPHEGAATFQHAGEQNCARAAGTEGAAGGAERVAAI